MVNLAWDQRLPDDLKKTFDEVAREALKLSDELYSRTEEEIIANLGKTVEIILPTPAVRSRMKAAIKPVYDFFVDRGDYTWNDINEAVKAAQSCVQE